MSGRPALVAGVGLALLALIACDPTKNPAWTLGGEPGMLFVVKQYYELNALEEYGRCSSPILEGVSSSRVVEDEPGRFNIDLTYYYRDMGHDRCERRLPNGACSALMECRGFAERSFAVGKDKEGLSVLEMSGPKKGRVRQPPPLRSSSAES